MNRGYSFHTLDVFTDKTFGGNQLAVLTDARGLSDEEMMRIAREFNLSETVFVFPSADTGNTRKVRIFTPGRELPFAGHPTVGTAYLLAALGLIDTSREITDVVLEEGVGPVNVAVACAQGKPVSATLTVAREPEFRSNAPSHADIAEMLSITNDEVGGSGLKPQYVSCGLPFLIAPLRDQAAVTRVALRHDVWSRVLGSAWTREIYLFDASAAGTGQPIRARMFAPELGISEDAATGSAAACLAAYLGVHTGGGEQSWTVHQGVEMGRPSVLELKVNAGNGSVSDIRVGGSAVLVSRGEITIP